MTAPLLEQLESITRNGRSYDRFQPNGTELEHRVIPSGHNSMLFRRDVASNVANFLRRGRFVAR